MNIIKRMIRFIRYNDYKGISIMCLVYSAWYRYQVLHMDSKKLRVKWGIEGMEDYMGKQMPCKGADSREAVKEEGYTLYHVPWMQA